MGAVPVGGGPTALGSWGARARGRWPRRAEPGVLTFRLLIPVGTGPLHGGQVYFLPYQLLSKLYLGFRSMSLPRCALS